MKNYKFLLILSVMMCIIVAFASCDRFTRPDGSEETTTDEMEVITEEEPLPTLEDPQNSDFLNIQYRDSWNVLDDSANLTKAYGECVGYSNGLLVFKKVTKDFMNNVSEIYSVYSAMENKMVYSSAAKYEDSNFESEDEFGNAKLPASELDVEILTVPGTDIPYIKATTYYHQRIDDAIIEDNKLDESYVTTYKIEYYDARGQLIDKTNVDNEASLLYMYSASNNSDCVALVGRKLVIFDSETFGAVSMWDATEERHMVNYDYRYGPYRYYLSTGRWNANVYKTGSKLEVYDNKDNLLTEYKYSDDAYAVMPHVLSNGNILLQQLFVLDSEDKNYDFAKEDLRFRLTTTLVEIPSGKATRIDFDYLLSYFMTKDDFSDSYLADNVSVELTSNVRNIAIAYKIEKKQLMADNEGELIFVDNMGNVQHVWDKIHPEQDIINSSMFAKALPTGDYLISLGSGVTKNAIVTKDGQIRAYLPEGASVVYDKVVLGNNIFDFDLNLLYSMDDYNYVGEDAFYSYSYTVEGSLGRYIIYSYTKTYLDGSAEDEHGIYTLDCEYITNVNAYLDNCVVVDLSDDYMVIYDMYDEQYRLLNSNIANMFVSDKEISVDEYESVYIVSSEYNGSSVYFSLVKSQIIQDEGGNE